MSGDTATAEAEGYARVEDMRQRDMANAQRLAELDLLQVTDTREGAQSGDNDSRLCTTIRD